jgi:transposase
MKLYGGIDLHSNNSVLVLIDEEDRVIYEKRLKNDLTLILRELAPFRRKLTGLVVESTYNWYWLVDGLREAGFGVHLANTAAIKQYEGLKHTVSGLGVRGSGQFRHSLLAPDQALLRAQVRPHQQDRGLQGLRAQTRAGGLSCDARSGGL